MTTIDRIYAKLKKHCSGNGYHRKVVLNKISPEDVHAYLRGEEINPATEEFVASAEDEVLFQFYIYDNTSQAGQQIRDALIRLNSKNKTPKINIKFLVDHRAGPAEWFTEKNPYKFDWLLKDEDGNYTILDTSGQFVKLDHLNIEYKIHDHYFFNSYHTKQIIVDRKKLMLRSGDICKDSNVYPANKGWVQVATVINNEVLARFAADSFHSRFKRRGSQTTPLPQENVDVDANVMVIEKNPSFDPFKRLFFDSPYKTALIEAIKNAKHSIKIMTSNLNDSGILQALINAISNRHIKVEIVTGKYQFQNWENKPTMGGTNKQAIDYLYEKIPVSAWDCLDIRWACSSESTTAKKCIIYDDNYEMMHGKVCIIDQELVFAGSSPLDVQSTKFSAESDCVIEDKTVADYYITHVFNPIFTPGAQDTTDKFTILKNSIIADLKKLTIVQLSYRQHEQYESYTNAKKIALDKLIVDIELANTFLELEQTVKSATLIRADNPFALYRRQSFSNLFSTFGHTSSIKQITTIYDLHFKQKLCRAEIKEEFKRQNDQTTSNGLTRSFS